MVYIPPWQQKRPPGRPERGPEPTLGQYALDELKAVDAEGEEPKPFGGWRGEAVVPRDEPAPPAPEPLVIPPADWDAELRERAQREAAERAARQLARQIEKEGA